MIAYLTRFLNLNDKVYKLLFKAYLEANKIIFWVFGF